MDHQFVHIDLHPIVVICVQSYNFPTPMAVTLQFCPKGFCRVPWKKNSSCNKRTVRTCNLLFSRPTYYHTATKWQVDRVSKTNPNLYTCNLSDLLNSLKFILHLVITPLCSYLMSIKRIWYKTQNIWWSLDFMLWNSKHSWMKLK